MEHASLAEHPDKLGSRERLFTALILPIVKLRAIDLRLSLNDHPPAVYGRRVDPRD